MRRHVTAEQTEGSPTIRTIKNKSAQRCDIEMCALWIHCSQHHTRITLDEGFVGARPLLPGVTEKISRTESTRSSDANETPPVVRVV